MTQHTVFTRKRVVQAAFELIREGGWEAVTARRIAERLGSSTMPIYSHLRSIAEVQEALREKGYALLRDFQQRSWTPDALMNLAFGYIAFARDEEHLFRFLFLERPATVGEEGLEHMGDSFTEQFGDGGEQAAALAELNPAAQGALMQHSWIFTHGLAVLVNSGSLGDCSDQTIIRLLNNAGEAFYLWAAGRAENGESRDRGANDDRQ